jgi:hypothetical protein
MLTNNVATTSSDHIFICFLQIVSIGSLLYNFDLTASIQKRFNMNIVIHNNAYESLTKYRQLKIQAKMPIVSKSLLILRFG